MRINITQPDDWIAAWKRAAKSAGKPLSEWIGDCCNARLPKEVLKQLGERVTAGRPRSE